jgi:hypothetical protein
MRAIPPSRGRAGANPQSPQHPHAKSRVDPAWRCIQLPAGMHLVMTPPRTGHAARNITVSQTLDEFFVIREIFVVFR